MLLMTFCAGVGVAHRNSPVARSRLYTTHPPCRGCRSSRGAPRPAAEVADPRIRRVVARQHPRDRPRNDLHRPAESIAHVNITIGESGGPGSTRSRLFYGGERTKLIGITGTTHNYPDVFHVTVEQGRFFTEGEVSHRRRMVVLGQTPYQALFPNVDPIGKDAIRDVTEVMRIRHGLRLDEPNDFDIINQDAALRLWDQISSATFLALVAISSIALLVGGIGVMAIMTISVKERTREIGTRKAIGARRREILWQFLLEAVFLTAVGGVLGIVFGSGIGLGVHYATEFPV